MEVKSRNKGPYKNSKVYRLTKIIQMGQYEEHDIAFVENQTHCQFKYQYLLRSTNSLKCLYKYCFHRSFLQKNEW